MVSQIIEDVLVYYQDRLVKDPNDCVSRCENQNNAEKSKKTLRSADSRPRRQQKKGTSIFIRQQQTLDERVSQEEGTSRLDLERIPLRLALAILHPMPGASK